MFVESGPGRRAYCINWNIKAKPVDFTRRLNDYTSRRPRLAEQRAVARHAIERVYYDAAGIRTVELASDSLSPAFVANLKALFFAASRPPLSRDLRALIVDRLRDIVGSAITPLELLNELSLSRGIDHEDFRNVLLSAIWRRELRVDLFERILFDRPLRPEKLDALERYGAWFSGDAS